jgi:hypothetical protein
MKPIETHYNGYHFRSRLEAKWAIFFEHLGIKFEYEPQGYLLNTGKAYLPDFYLPYFGKYYCEVKPYGGDFSKAIDFAIESTHAILLLEGPPDFVAYELAFSADGKGWCSDEVAFLYADAAAENRLFVSGLVDVNGKPAERLSQLEEEFFDKRVHEAITAARSFRG